MVEKLIEAIRNKKITLALLGSGRVGLSTAAIFAEAGFHVIAVDIKPEIVNTVNNGISPIDEPGLQELISHNVKIGRLKAALMSDNLFNRMDAIIVSVQTPITQDKKPNLSFLINALEDVGKILKKEILVTISSTLAPRTMLEKIRPKLESLSGLKSDIDFYLAYVPERIAPGNAVKEFINSPRLVGGVGPKSTKVAAELFRTVCKTVIETDATTAEIAKLAENTFRDVNIAFAKELALICEQCSVDVMEVIKLANTHPRVNIHMPGPGVGGPCLPKDPYLLLNQSKLVEYDVIKSARVVNDYMPKHIVRLVLRALKEAEKGAGSSRIAVLGTAYKADVDDSRLSPSEPVIHYLLELGANIIVYDPYCREGFGAEIADSLHEAVKDADCLVIMTDHKEFRNLCLKKVRMLMKDKSAIVDAKRIVNPLKAEKLGFLYYGVGFVKRGYKDIY
ncbi:MAG: nucleotide sugar dehydrogenase [Candidatus Bathyarchaeia archaeon]